MAQSLTAGTWTRCPWENML